MRPSAGGPVADYDPDEDYEDSEPEVEPVIQVKREVNPDAEFANMDILHKWTLHRRMMPQDLHMRILLLHRVQGPEIMALKFQDMYTRP